MTDKTQALRDLMAKVEAGADETDYWWNDNVFGDLREPLYIYGQPAFYGSLNAAKALHDAVLPMWDCYLKISADKNPHRAELRPLTPMSGNPSIIIQWGGCPARALLIAILRALIAQATP